LTIQAYRSDITQFITYLSENDYTVTTPAQVSRGHITEYLKYLAHQGQTGTTRARKLVSLQVFFTSLVKNGSLYPTCPSVSSINN
jgi:site-specific recombinase XerD